MNKIAKQKLYFLLIFIATILLFSGCDSNVGNIQPTANIQKTTEVQGVSTEIKEDVQPVANIKKETQVKQEKAVNNNNSVETKNQKVLKAKKKPTPIVKKKSCGSDYYRNVSGNCVHRPSANPSGASAECRDGSYSYSQHRRGTCSGHGGVAEWY